jgi:chromosomal replication initiator protein
MTPLTLGDREKILSYLESTLDAKVYDTWCRSLSLEKAGENSVRVPTANPFYRDWLERLLKKPLEDAFLQLFGSAPEIVFQVGDVAAPAPPAPAPAAAPAETPAAPPDFVLNPSYTFENYIEGPSNRMAYAAARAASENPATLYNPLFIHGGVGLGKTHLLQALCHAILRRNPAAKVIYLSCEEFVNGYIAAVQNLGRLEAFRARYRSADVLVVDDIHFLRGKEGSQEEFFHTFNALHIAGRQVVLSSDQPAAEIRTLKEHLRSRFTSGFAAMIDVPTYETRLAILRRKAATLGREVPEDALALVASTIDTNIRDLEGKLTQLIGLAAASGQKPDAELAKEVLRHLSGRRAASVSIPEIQQVVAKFYGKKVSDLQTRRWTKSTSLARQVCIYLCRRFTAASLKELGSHFGGKDHTTILYSIRKVEQLIAEDPTVRSAVERLTREVSEK